MKIPFDIKFRPKIESGEYKVVTEDDEPARIICWDSTINKERPIIAIVFDDQIEQYKADGRYDNDYDTSNYDLFIVTPDEELTDFEKAVGREIFDPPFNEKQIKVIKEESEKLLSIAKKELLSEKMLIERTYSPDINKAHELGRKEGIMIGKAEALKDLPK